MVFQKKPTQRCASAKNSYFVRTKRSTFIFYAKNHSSAPSNLFAVKRPFMKFPFNITK